MKRNSSGDEERRRRERESKAFGSRLGDRVRELSDRLRGGQITEARVRLAALCGNEVAMNVIGTRDGRLSRGFDKVDAELKNWLLLLRELTFDLSGQGGLGLAFFCFVDEFSLMERNELDGRSNQEEMDVLAAAMQAVHKIALRLVDGVATDSASNRVLLRHTRAVREIEDHESNEGMEALWYAIHDVGALLSFFYFQNVSRIPGHREMALSSDLEVVHGIMKSTITALVYGLPEKGEINERFAQRLMERMARECLPPVK